MGPALALEYTDEAQDDLLNVIEHGAEQGYPDPVSYAEHLDARIMMLADFPRLGRTGRIPGTFELVLGGTPYLVVYGLTAETVIVYRVLHSSRLWPPG